MKERATWFLAVAAVAGAILTSGCALTTTGEKPATIARITYHGWEDAFRLRSESAEVIVVPQIGRVMSFRLLDGENVFWEDRTLDGKRGDVSGKEWINFGGDKTWPAPEAEWSRYTGRKQWMPPAAFDAMPIQAALTNNKVVLTSPVDPHYGVRTIRRVQLSGSHLRIDTTYERVSGGPSKIGVWVITQFKEPVAIYALADRHSIFTNGYFQFGNEPWPQLRRQGEHLEVTRDPKASHKMGSDTDRLMWVGEKETCVVSSLRVSGAEYPDRGASAEVYTNPDPKKYIELELLGPLSLMKPGDRISRSSTYVLRKRAGKNPEAELPRLGR
jgi:hypothetical protein